MSFASPGGEVFRSELDKHTVSPGSAASMDLMKVKRLKRMLMEEAKRKGESDRVRCCWTRVNLN